MTDRKTVAQASEDYLKLVEWVLAQTDGVLLEYDQVTRETGVAMDTEGKAKLRRAIRKTRREYANIPGVGQRLANPGMVMGILSQRLRKIDGAVVRADRSQQVLQASFYGSLGEEAQRGILFLGSIFGAIRLASRNGQRLYAGKKDRPALPTSTTIEIPNMP